MLLSLGRAMAPAAVAGLLLAGDGLLTENGRLLTGQNGAALLLDVAISGESLPLLTETGDPLSSEAGDGLVSEAPAGLSLESGDFLMTENDTPLAVE